MRSPITRLGAVLGTPYFMAPEQHRGRRATAATDQFSFCVALWLALYGEHPFAIDGDIAEAVIVGRRRPVPRARVPRAVARIVERGLAVDPDARHPSMESLVAALERALRRPRWPYAAAAVAVLGAAVAIAVVGGRPGPQADARTPVAIRHATAPLFRIASALAGQDVATAGDALFDGFAASDDPAHLLDAMRVYYRAGRCDGAVRAQQAYAVAMRGAPMPPDDVRLELIEIHRDCSVPYLATNDLAELDRLAMRYAARADLSGAIATLKRMRELEPDAAQRARYMLRIGDYALGHGKCKSAEAAYEIYLKELPAESTPPSEAARLQAQLARCVPSDPE